MTVYLRYAARSDRGLVRRNNQDSVFAGPRLLAVADGMGGHVGGEVASRVVIAAIEYLDQDESGGDMLAALQEATYAGTTHLREIVEDRPELDGMGTTLTALLFNGRRIGVCHIGDSRAYLFRDDALHQITHDDTFVQALIDEGRITEEEATVHPQRSVILRALNGDDVDPDLSMREGRPGDRYLLCSDGLCGFVSHERIEKVLRTARTPDEAADQLIDFALRAGGPDNVTVIVADLVDDDDADKASTSPVVDGAAGNNIGQREMRGDSPASRAALISKQPPPEDDEPTDPADDDPPAGRSRRRWLIILAALVLLAGMLLAGRAYVNSQYFVGVDAEDVVIYNGVNTEIGPVKLYSIHERTDYKIADLQKATRLSLRNGVSAKSLEDARDIVGRLEDRLLPYCDEPGTNLEPSTTSEPATTDSPTSDPATSDSATSAAASEPTTTDASATSEAASSASAPASGDDAECRPRQ